MVEDIKNDWIITPSIVMSVSVCLCVSVCCLSAIISLENYLSDLYHIFIHITYGRGSVLLWRRSDTLCTSGFLTGRSQCV